ncbi:DENN domain-containing protein 11 [Lamellibrachia satsuma]|nr:DENN domain-containing protein 11 [Lamellibrachia satsuma]
MADDSEESAHLLLNSQGLGSELLSPRQQVKSLYESPNVLGKFSPYTGREDGNINIISASSSVQNLALESETDHIVTVFVVAFDTKAGNVVEWCMPEDMDLDGVEFKAMASGSHTLTNDFVYFRHGKLYGLACFANMSVASAAERGARMKSVGILATSYTLLYRHMQFLETQVRHQLETPQHYRQLEAFWEDKKGLLPASGSSQSVMTSSSTSSSDIHLDLKVAHPAGCFTHFINFFNIHIFSLWKFALLGKRILFFSPPPIGSVCYRVYVTCCLANHSLHTSVGSTPPKPHFYVNVADINSLESELSYIACTTEKIFETKKHLYDVYVNCEDVTTTCQALDEVLKISDADRDKLRKLNNQRLAAQFSQQEHSSGGTMDEEEVFTSFFLELNEHLLQTLIDVSSSDDRTLTSDHMKNMGLDPIGDRSFLMELLEVYGIDVMLLVDNPCCPK